MDFKYYDEVVIPVRKVNLGGELIVPQSAKAIVIFSHGSGSSHNSPRNKQVAGELHKYRSRHLVYKILILVKNKIS